MKSFSFSILVVNYLRMFFADATQAPLVSTLQNFKALIKPVEIDSNDTCAAAHALFTNLKATLLNGYSTRSAVNGFTFTV